MPPQERWHRDCMTTRLFPHISTFICPLMTAKRPFLGNGRGYDNDRQNTTVRSGIFLSFHILKFFIFIHASSSWGNEGRPVFCWRYQDCAHDSQELIDSEPLLRARPRSIEGGLQQRNIHLVIVTSYLLHRSLPATGLGRRFSFEQTVVLHL